LLINLPRKWQNLGKKIKIYLFFNPLQIFAKTRLEAEVYKFNGFTVNLFINKGFDPSKA
jgi:hypothetical protein